MGPFMSWVVAIDESGDLGKGTRYFCMAALIVRRPRHLRKAYDSIPKRGYESKFSNSSDEEISLILRSVAEVDVRIVYSAVDKYDYNGDSTDSWAMPCTKRFFRIYWMQSEPLFQIAI